jgi:aspartokinase/homoserine dehydrogenase 1
LFRRMAALTAFTGSVPAAAPGLVGRPAGFAPPPQAAALAPVEVGSGFARTMLSAAALAATAVTLTGRQRSARGAALRRLSTAASAPVAAGQRWAASGICATSGQTTRHAGSGAALSQTLHLGVVGYGLVGKELVAQIQNNVARLQAELGVKVEVAAVARSKSMLLLPAGGDGCLAGGAWPAGEVPADLGKLADHVLAAAAASGGRAMMIDNTASDTPAELYESWLAAGADVATPNKRAGSGPYARYERIMEAARQGGSRFLYEATVGAGLPIVGPFKGLLAAGDEMEAVEGIFSGTLSYIFNTWKPGMKFSEVVKDAKDKGFTEPDPRDDLSGTDVQRKVTILARETGMKVELGDVPVKSLVPAALQDWQPPAGENLGEAFVKELSAYDDEMDAMITEAEAADEVLRFVGAVDVKSGSASVKLARYPKDHPFAATQFADNIVTFASKWYTPRPLVIQGPGAGAEVTAAGIFGNVLEVAQGMKQPC